MTFSAFDHYWQTVPFIFPTAWTLHGICGIRNVDKTLTPVVQFWRCIVNLKEFDQINRRFSRYPGCTYCHLHIESVMFWKSLMSQLSVVSEVEGQRLNWSKEGFASH